MSAAKTAALEAEVYLFTGPENGDKNDAAGSLKAAAEKKNGAVDFYRYYAGETRIIDVISQLENVSLFSAALFVVLKNAELIKGKDDIALIASYIKNSQDSPNTLILESDENSVEKPLEALFPPSRKKVFWEMFDNQKPQWVIRYFQKNGFQISMDAVEQILDMVENNTETLRAECSRFFFCFEKGHQISTEDVDKILAHNREENAFTLFAAMADPAAAPKERLETSLAILQKIRLSRDASGTALLAGLAYCFRQLRSWQALHAGQAVPNEAQLRAAGFSGKKKRTQYGGAARVWGPGAAASILSLIAATDMDIRSGGAAMEDTRLSLLLYSIIMKNGVYPAQYE